MSEEVYHDPSRPIPEMTEEMRKKEQAEIVKRSVAAHAELTATKPTPTPEEIKAFRDGEPAPTPVPVHSAPVHKKEEVKATEGKSAEERGMYETRAARARARGEAQ